MEKRDEEFIKAVVDDEVERVRLMIREEKDLDGIELYEGMPILRYLIQQKKYEMFSLFLRHGASVRSHLDGNTSIVDEVRKSGDPKLIQILDEHLGHVGQIDQEVNQATAARDFSQLKKQAGERESEQLERDLNKPTPAAHLRHRLIDLFSADIDYALFCEEFVQLDNPFLYSNDRQETLLHLAVKFQRYDIIKIIVKHELFQQYCKTQNQFGKTALHVTVISGDLEAYKILIAAMVTQSQVTCTNGLTILHYAAQYGQLGILTEMLFGVLDMFVSQLFNICDDAGKFALHYAAAQDKSVECLEVLLEKETRAIAIDNLRNTPLHYAAIYGIYQNVRVLLEAGLSPYQRNSEGKTPIDLAVELGHHDIADLMSQTRVPDNPIIGYGHIFSPDVRQKLYRADQYLLKNQAEHVLPLLTDLRYCAKDSSNHQLEIFVMLKAGQHIIFDAESNYLSHLYPQMKLSERDWDSEKAIAMLLEESERAGHSFLMVKCLKRLGDFSLEKKQTLKAAQLYNSALALYQNSIPSIRVGGAQTPNKDEQFLLRCILSTVEKMGLFLNLDLRFDQSRIQSYRNLLNRARSECSFTRVEQSQKNHAIMTQCYRAVLGAMVEHNSKLLGIRVDQFSVVLCGSVARNETSLYSDVEYLIIAVNDDPKLVRQLENMARLIELDVINIRETEFRILNRGQKSILKAGFCLDSHGITPRGRIDPTTEKTISEFKLIGSPKTIAQLVNQNHFFSERELVVSLCTTAHLIGNTQLSQSLVTEITAQLDNSSSILNRMIRFFSPQVTLRTLMSQQCLLALTDEFQVRLDQVKNQEKFFMVKQELYRILERFISSLSMLAHCSENSAWLRLDFFVKEKILTPQAGNDLKNALNLALLLRCRVQNHYQSEFDGVWHLRSDSTQYVLPNGMKAYEVYLLSKADVEDIQSIYRALLPIGDAVKKLIAKNYSVAVLQECSFKAKLNQAQGRFYSSMHDYEHANEYYEKAIALNPNNADEIASYIKALSMRGESKKAMAIGLEAMQRWEQQSNTVDLNYALLLNNLAYVFSNNGRKSQAHEIAQKAFKIVQQLAPMSVFSHMVLLTLVSLCDNQKDKTAYLSSCEQIEQTQPVDPSMVAKRIQKSAAILRENRKLEESVKLIDIALKIVTQSQGDYRIAQSDILADKALILWELGHAAEAYKLYQELLELSLKIHGEFHETTEASYGGKSVSLLRMKKFEQAKIDAEKALAINLKIGPDPNDRLGIRYNVLARICQGLGMHAEAIEYEKKAVAADKKYYGIDHEKTAIRLGDLAAVALGHNMQVWEEATEESLEITQRINPSRLGAFISNIAYGLFGLHDYERCVKYFIRLIPFIDNHQELSVVYSNIAGLYHKLGDFEKSAEYQGKLSSLQKEPPPVLISNQAVFFRQQQNYPAAILKHKEAIAAEKRLNGPKSEMLGKLNKYLADTYTFSGNYLEAAEHYNEAIGIFRPIFGDDRHPLIQECFSQLEFVQQLLAIALDSTEAGTEDPSLSKRVKK